MSLFSSVLYPQYLPSLSLVKPTPITSCLSHLPSRAPYCTLNSQPHLHPSLAMLFTVNDDSHVQSRCCATTPANSNAVPEDEPDLNSENKTRRIRQRKKSVAPQDDPGKSAKVFPSTIPRKPRRGRRSEAAAVEDFVRDSLERTFASIREQNPELCIEKEQILKERSDKENNSDISDDDNDNDDNEVGENDQQMIVEEENPNWPLDADIGWGIRASEYFEKHAIKNVIGEDGTEIDWEGELDDNWVQEINCLEWESFAFHPSPLIVLVFERYNRASDNWMVLKELEKALKVYWNAKDRLPPRAGICSEGLRVPSYIISSGAQNIIQRKRMSNRR